MNPRPTQKWYNHLYEKEFWEVKQEKDRWQLEKQVVKEALWADKFIKFLDQQGFGESRESPEILEIGCAYGVIGKVVAENYSGRAFGIEPSSSARKIAENITGVKIFAYNMEEVISGEEKNLFDLIIFSHVLENITDPLSALEAARRLLKVNGVLLIDTPNNFVRKSWHIHHPYCYTRPSLTKLLNTAGFKVCIAKEWSRPKFLLGLAYLTVYAIKNEGDYPTETKTTKRSIRNYIGRMLFNAFGWKTISDLNRLFAAKKWKVSGISEQVVNNIKQKLSDNNSY